MENMRQKIKLKLPLKSKVVENGESEGPRESSSHDYADPDARTDQGNGFFPTLSGGFKRKREHKAGHRRQEHKIVTAPVNTGVLSIFEDVGNVSGYEDNEDRMADEEELKMGNGMHYMLGSNNAASKPEEARTTKRVQYRQGSLRVKLKPSKSSNLYSNGHSENQVKADNEKINSTSAHLVRQDQSSYADLRRESNTLTSPPNVHTDKSEWFREKLSISQPKPMRFLDGLSTPRKMRSGRSSEMPNILHQSEPVESLWKSESQRTRALEISERPLKKDHRSLQSAKKEGGCLSQINKEELKSALMVVKKIMNMDAAEPFNSPVDPVALGIPDYFDIIDTPMDLGTICLALEKGDKYKTSKDVFHDIQLVWDNCVEYNRKGDPILDLMRRVKKNFNKYWMAAGLYYEPSKRSGTVNFGKVDAPLHIEDDNRIKGHDDMYLNAESSDRSMNSLKREHMIFSQPSPENLSSSKATQNILKSTSTGSRKKQRNAHHYDFEAMEMQQSSEDSEARADISQRSKGNAMVRKGMKFVIRSSLTKDDLEEKTVLGRNIMQESISAESGPMRGDSDRSLQEETEQMNLGIKMKSHHRQRIHRHRPGCLCAVCVSTRRKLAREGKLPVVTAETRSNANVSETMIEEPSKIKVEQEMDKTREQKENNEVEKELDKTQELEENNELEKELDKTQEQKENNEAEQDMDKTEEQKENIEDTDMFDERSRHGQEALEVQGEEEQRQKNKAQTQEDLEKDLSGKDYYTDFKFPLQNTSPSISKMGTILFETWNWRNSLVYHPPRECSKNPIMAAMSSFRD